MSKSIKAVMAFLTAMTMTVGAMGVTSYAEEAPVEVTMTESAQTDGMFSLGAEYRFISGPDVLIIDGEGSFTEREFYEAAKQFDPRTVVLGDEIDIPVSRNVGSEWLFNVSSLSSTFSVFAHKNSKAYKLWKSELKKEFNDYLEANDISIGNISYGDIFTLYALEDRDIYESFSYDPAVVENGRDMEQYLLNNGIRQDIAREFVGHYMFGLNDRMKNHSDGQQVYANADGTEINQKTADYFKDSCRMACETEQDILDKIFEGNKGEGAVSKFLLRYDVNADTQIEIDIRYVHNSKHTLSLISNAIVRSFLSFGDQKEASPADDDPEDTEKPMPEEEKKYEPAKILNGMKTKATLKGDVDVNGTVELTDVVVLSKYTMSYIAYPLADYTAYANSDINDDKDINGLDVSALIENQLGRRELVTEPVTVTEAPKISESVYSRINAGEKNIKVHIICRITEDSDIMKQAYKLADEYMQTLSDEEYTSVEKQKLKNKYAYEKKVELFALKMEKTIGNTVKSLGEAELSVCDEHDYCLFGTLTPEQIKALEDNELVGEVFADPVVLPDKVEQLVSKDGTFSNHELIYSDKYRFAVESLPADPDRGLPERDVLVVYDIPYEDTTGMSQGEWKKHISINYTDYSYLDELWLPGGPDRLIYSGCRYLDVASKNQELKLEKDLEIVFVVNGERPKPDYDKTEEQINSMWGFDIFKYVNYNKNTEDTDTKENTGSNKSEK